ncbi:MAG: twin-arginine translocase subunit TatC [Proteobacteria bacterium]|nr:twin-arginine translocase subunit TatC [Pseudomonadota bacterium]
MDEQEKLPITAHLEELRTRLIWSLIAVGLGFLACYAVKEDLFQILARPLLSALPEGDKLIFTGLPEPFFTYLKISFFGGVVLALPVIMYQVWKFVAPGLYLSERNLLFPLVFLSCLFFAMGASFGYFVVFPFGFKFFLGFAGDSIQAMPSMREYLSLTTKLLLGFGIVFQLPLFITAFARFGLVSVDFLKKQRKYAILLFFIAAAILTPPDVITQILMAIPLMALYELSIVGARIFGKKPPQEEPEAPES